GGHAIGRQNTTDPGAADVERHGAHGHADRDLPQSRAAVGLRHSVGEGLFYRLADRGRDRVRRDAGGAPPDRSHRDPAWPRPLMLTALDLARRIEAGALTPRAVVDLCAKSIAEREKEIGAFVTLDLEAARRAAERAGLAQTPLHGLPVGVKDIYDTADFPTEYGSSIYAGHRPKADAAMVVLTRRAG